MVVDMSVPALDLLLGPDAANILAAAAGEYDAGLTALRVADAHVAPTGGVRVRYVADVRRADGSVRGEVFVAATGDRIPAGAAVLAGEFAGTPVEVGVWRWPQDPALPGMAVAAHPARLAELLATAGLTVPPAPRISVRAYRPGQRAVLEIGSASGGPRWFVKVVRPALVAELQLRHRLLGATLPVPPVVAADERGLIVLPEAPGTVLRELLATDAAIPSPQELQDTLDALPATLLELPTGRGHLRRIEDSARVLELTTAANPAVPERLRNSVADQLRSAADQPAGPVVPVHGDFYEAQLLIEHGRISGVIDVDSAGPGERVDEWANLLGHLSVFGLRTPRAAAYGAEILAHARDHADAEDLAVRTAAVVFGLATGPFRTQRDGWAQRTRERLELAQRWLSSMRTHSSSAPAPLIFATDS